MIRKTHSPDGREGLSPSPIFPGCGVFSSDDLARSSPSEGYPSYLEWLRRCDECGLAQGAKHLVAGEGPPDSPLMHVGEAPGFEEDRQGHPFVGPSGRLLDQTLSGIGVSRSRIFITNLVKYRPPDNRLPRAKERHACAIHL